MPHFDIFNGDADGICAIQQIRLNTPQESTLVTGVKRDTLLLKNVISVKNSVLTVVDNSSHANRDSILQLLNQGTQFIILIIIFQEKYLNLRYFIHILILVLTSVQA